MNKTIYVIDASGDSSWYEFLSKSKSQGNDTIIQVSGIYSPLDTSWTPGTAGKEGIRLLDHGNGVDITFPKNNLQKERTVKLGYDEISFLTCLMDYYRKDIEKPAAEEDISIKKMKEVEMI